MEKSLREQIELQVGQQIGERQSDAALDAARPLDPSVSVIIPCFNEERFIGKVLENLAGQHAVERYEIIIVDGMSTDNTRAVIAEFMQEHPEIAVRMIDNPARNIPTALNLGVGQARHEIIIRMDAHSIPSENYVRRCIEGLQGAEASIVGMPWRIKAGDDSVAARAIALAVAHPFGIGDAKYRLADTASQFVDTVPFGAFRKSLWQEVGGYNEALLSNEDYDFHYRVRQRGGRILLDTDGHSIYFARPSFKTLAAQYARYGRWKAQMIKRHPRSLRLRQLAAPLFVLSLIVLTALSVWRLLALEALLLVVVPYLALALWFATKLSRRARDWRLLPAIVWAFLIIHITWGGNFLLGLVHSPRQ